MVHAPPDKEARAQALDPHQSFIVQAPAGSGKTELLIQRFLVLLVHVKKTPEEIIAITFTRKAAAEMRQRILDALEAAQQPAPDAPHAKQTWMLAKKVLENNEANGWRLLENPQRLQIQTIDSLCLSLIRRMPLLAKFGSTPNILENPRECYVEAARRLMTKLETDEPYAQSLSYLLLHLNNDVSLLELLFTDMLSKRDQWLPYLIPYYDSDTLLSFRKILEDSLKHVIEETLSKCREAMPDHLVSELLALLSFSATQLSYAESDHIFLPAAAIENYGQWLTIATFLLTKENAWRKTVNKNNGFPSEYKAMKSRMLYFLEEISKHSKLRENLMAIQYCPTPTYSDNQWKIVEALIDVLPMLVAELSVILGEKNVSDFTEITLAAMRALGDLESPSELALILDYQIRHLLIDEFQDTSTTQFRLLTYLTRGWEAGDQRTLFLVGDPMQSIYRFREAEVGLFLKAQQEGLGNIELVPIFLTANFRSTQPIVQWINTQFERIFPDSADISSGAVSFNPSIAIKQANEPWSVHVYPHVDMQSQVKTIVELIQKERMQHPHHTIGLLVRSRTHLIEMIPALKTAGLSFTAIEIESLKHQSITQDLMALTTALLHLNDRAAWLAILRAPWCGLNLHDLYALSGKNHQALVWELMQAVDSNPTISQEGKVRLKKVCVVLTQSLSQKQRLPLRTWIEETWKLLGGECCLLNHHELATAKVFFSALEEMEVGGDLPDLDLLFQTIQEQYVTPENASDNTLHIMTIHKAKGLEFDTVIIPHLERKGRGESERLLRWLDRPRSQGVNDLLLAPIKPKDEKEEAIYRYLHLTETKKIQYEMARLLYVAVTRAKKTLHLLADVDHELKHVTKDSFLSLIHETFKERMAELSVEKQDGVINHELTKKEKFFRRLYLKDIEDNNIMHPKERTHIYPALISKQTHFHEWSRHIGTVTHRVLQRISQTSLHEWTEEKIDEEKSLWKKWLNKLGVISFQLEEGIHTIEKMILSTLHDPRGRWILEKREAQASELAITMMCHEKPVQMVIDRTFVDENQIRWIIDYKTSWPENEDVDIFLDRAMEMHHEQLTQYAFAFEHIESRPIRLGLYFPGCGGWREWEHRQPAIAPSKSPILQE